MALCYICRQEEAVPGMVCCDDIECIRKYNAGRRWMRCSRCGEEYLNYRANGTKKKLCWKCEYKEKFETYKKNKEAAPKTSGGIDGVLAEQEEIHKRTGRYVSYGKLMARKG